MHADDLSGRVKPIASSRTGFVQVRWADAVDLSRAIAQAPVHVRPVGRGASVKDEWWFGFMAPWTKGVRVKIRSKALQNTVPTVLILSR